MIDLRDGFLVSNVGERPWSLCSYGALSVIIKLLLLNATSNLPLLSIF